MDWKDKLSDYFEQMATDQVARLSQEDKAFIDKYRSKLLEAQDVCNSVIIGQPDMVNQTIIAMISGQNAIITGLPGRAKSFFVETLGTIFGLTTNRIQGTPDLMPSDILGVEVMESDPETGKRSFRFIDGPIFAQLVMDDEINRASPRTQAAMLQAMQEKKITVGGQTRKLPQPHIHLATRNPVEQEGTYPLPEAQLDRFGLEIVVDDASKDAEGYVMLESTQSPYNVSDLRSIDESGEDITPPGNMLQNNAKNVMSARDLVILQHLVRNMPLTTDVYNAILNTVRDSRPDVFGTMSDMEGKTERDIDELIKNSLDFGPGPRALQAFCVMVKARALLEGRYAPGIQDVIALAEPIMRHRMRLQPGAKAEGVNEKKVIQALTARL